MTQVAGTCKESGRDLVSVMHRPHMYGSIAFVVDTGGQSYRV